MLVIHYEAMLWRLRHDNKRIKVHHIVQLDLGHWHSSSLPKAIKGRPSGSHGKVRGATGK